MFLPENIDLANAENYNLIIRLKTDGFAFFIYDIESKENYSSQDTIFSNDGSLLNNLQRIIFDLTFLTENFNKVYVIVVSENFDIIPYEFYSKNTDKELYERTHIVDEEQVLGSVFSENGYKVLFGLEEEVYSFLKRSLFNPVFCHYNDLSINFFCSKVSDNNKRSMILNFHDDYADIICFDKDGKLSHIHNYYKEADENLIYYLLNTWENFGFDQLSDVLYISNLHPDNKIEAEVNLYIKNIKILETENPEIPIDIVSIM